MLIQLHEHSWLDKSDFIQNDKNKKLANLELGLF